MRKNVIIIKDTKGKVVYVAYPKMLEENEINKAINECNKYQQNVELEKNKLLDRIDNLEKCVLLLNLDIKLDRGEITQEEYDKELDNYGK